MIPWRHQRTNTWQCGLVDRQSKSWHLDDRRWNGGSTGVWAQRQDWEWGDWWRLKLEQETVQWEGSRRAAAVSPPSLSPNHLMEIKDDAGNYEWSRPESSNWVDDRIYTVYIVAEVREWVVPGTYLCKTHSSMGRCQVTLAGGSSMLSSLRFYKWCSLINDLSHVSISEGFTIDQYSAMYGYFDVCVHVYLYIYVHIYTFT